jgi:hypothetical protein
MITLTIIIIFIITKRRNTMDVKAMFAKVLNAVKENKKVVVPVVTGVVGALIGATVGVLATRDVGPDQSWEPTAEEIEMAEGTEEEPEED